MKAVFVRLNRDSMKANKLKRFERVPVAAIPADTPEERAAFIAELVVIGEKMPSAGVSGESLADILADYKKPRSVIVNDVNGNRVTVRNGVTEIISEGMQNFVTKNDSSDAERIQNFVTKFDSSELEILEKLKNG